MTYPPQIEPQHNVINRLIAISNFLFCLELFNLFEFVSVPWCNLMFDLTMSWYVNDV